MRLTHPIFVLVWLFATVGIAWAQRSETVSPGRPDDVVAIAQTCPSFSWSAVDDAVRYDLVVFVLSEDGAAEADRPPVLETSLPGSALSWTPSLDMCLEAGRQYAWFVRAIDSLGGGEWSRASLFAPMSAPSAYDVDEALRLLREHVNATSPADRAVALPRESAVTPPVSGQQAGAEESGARALPAKGLSSGIAAIQGEVPNPTGETYGVRGISNSLAGAGIGAANTAGGVDLLLDGSSTGAADALLNESGLDRRSLTAQTFAFTNSQGGGMSLEVDGAAVVTTATDEDSLGALACSTDEVARWNGSAWECSADAGLPSGAVMFFDLSSCPSGWSEFAGLQGRVPLGLPTGGTGGLTVGTALPAGGLRTIRSVPAHSHEVNPPNTASFSTGIHTHSVDPVAVTTSSAGGHTHTGTTDASNVTLDISNGGYSTIYVQGAAFNGTPDLNVISPADSHTHTFTTSAAGGHSHSINLAATASSAAGTHSHNVDIPSFTSANTGVSAVDVTMPYVQLLACRKN